MRLGGEEGGEDWARGVEEVVNVEDRGLSPTLSRAKPREREWKTRC